MRITYLDQCPAFISGDGASLRELANGRRDGRAFRYSFAHTVVKPGVVTKPHRLRTSEVYYILTGCGRMHIGQEVAVVGPGAFIEIPPSAIQYIENTGSDDLVFLCLVDPGWAPADEEIL